jgi:hypothetical protein
MTVAQNRPPKKSVRLSVVLYLGYEVLAPVDGQRQRCPRSSWFANAPDLGSCHWILHSVEWRRWNVSFPGA